MVAVAAGDFVLASQNADHESRISSIEAYDTFHNLTLSSPFTNRAASFLPCQYTKTKINGVEFVLIYLSVSATTTGNGQLVCTLPAGARPASTQDWGCSGGGSSTVLTPVFEVSATNGEIRLWDNAIGASLWQSGWKQIKGPFT